MHASASPSETPSIAEGWLAATDGASGHPYYYEISTGKTSWEIPTDATQQSTDTTRESESEFVVSNPLRKDVSRALKREAKV
jgi:hypothetical protein